MSTSRSNKETREYGAPLATPKPGQTKRKRPKVGDRSGDDHLRHPKKRTPSKPEANEDGYKGSAFRDYRGVDGAVEDAEKGKKKK